MNVYRRGESIFLYTRFQDSKGNFVNASQVMVRILHESQGNIIEDLAWTNMQQFGTYAYGYTWQVPFNADYGYYEVIYQGLIGDENAENTEEFNIIGSSEQFEDSIKVWGNIHDARTGNPIIGAEVIVTNQSNNEQVYQDYSDDGGLWESHIYPGQYEFKFSKPNYKTVSVVAQINSQDNEIQFDNIVLESEYEEQVSKGNGIYTVKDQYITKEGYGLRNLTVSAADIFNPSNIVATNTTDDNGNWELFLNPGDYFLQVSGTSLGTDYNKQFRLKVEESGKTRFEDLSSNIATIASGTTINAGSGPIDVSDQVLDAKGNPIMDTTVSAATAIYTKGQPLPSGALINPDYYDSEYGLYAGAEYGEYKPDPKSGYSVGPVVAETITDMNGNWTLHLNTGTYLFTYSNPAFRKLTEYKTITQNSVINVDVSSI